MHVTSGSLQVMVDFIDAMLHPCNALFYSRNMKINVFDATLHYSDAIIDDLLSGSGVAPIVTLPERRLLIAIP